MRDIGFVGLKAFQVQIYNIKSDLKLYIKKHISPGNLAITWTV